MSLYLRIFLMWYESTSWFINHLLQSEGCLRLKSDLRLWEGNQLFIMLIIKYCFSSLVQCHERCSQILKSGIIIAYNKRKYHNCLQQKEIYKLISSCRKEKSPTQWVTLLVTSTRTSDTPGCRTIFWHFPKSDIYREFDYTLLQLDCHSI